MGLKYTITTCQVGYRIYGFKFGEKFLVFGDCCRNCRLYEYCPAGISLKKEKVKDCVYPVKINPFDFFYTVEVDGERGNFSSLTRKEIGFNIPCVLLLEEMKLS